MTDNTASIADAQARERASDIAQQSPAGNTDDVPSNVYVSWAGQNVRFWSIKPSVNMDETTYVVQSELDAAIRSERERANVLVEAWREYFAACEELAELERQCDTTKRFDKALYRKGDAEDMARNALASWEAGNG